MDELLRRLERQASAGDYNARQQWKRALARAGYPDPDEAYITAPLNEAEEAQQDYDDLFWHAKGPKYFMWGGYCSCCRDSSIWSSKLVKAHKPTPKHTPKNFKRQTLRTHRDGSRKNYRLRVESHDSVEQTETTHSRRRKKRFGGRGHLSCEWVRNPETGDGRVVWMVHEPRLDD